MSFKYKKKSLSLVAVENYFSFLCTADGDQSLCQDLPFFSVHLKLYLKAMFNTPACSVFIVIYYGIPPSSILRQLLFSVCVMLQFPYTPSAIGASVPLLHCKFCFKLPVKAQQMYIYHLGDYLTLLNNLHIFDV